MSNAIVRGFRYGFNRLFGYNRPRSREYRVYGSQMAVVLVHGFSGSVLTVWNQYAEWLEKEPQLNNWDILGAGYSTSLRVDVPGVWKADPDLQLLADGLRTTLALPPFDGYRTIAIVAHSMGGLVVQRALADDEELSKRCSHVFMFGVPSAGVNKSRFFAALKRQIADLNPTGRFIKKLRDDWTQRFEPKSPFAFFTIGGERDEFVSQESSLDPFDRSLQRVIEGSHSDIVRPTDANHQGLTLVIQALCGIARRHPAIDSGKLAVEQSEFQAAVNSLLPNVVNLDESALIALALALDGLNRTGEALQVLESYGHKQTTDAIGTLAGRYKRRWLVDRSASDLQRANDLYTEALNAAERNQDFPQCYYLAINLAALAILSAPPNSVIPQHAKDLAQRAKSCCERSATSHWSLATEGEAALILGDLDRAVVFYEAAIKRTNSPREMDSMYSQAIRIASRTLGEQGAKRIETVFGVPNA